ncbi:MAG: MauE/DoxX family redox-associated membrane protein [Gammaproteobacteria bacterium]
MSVDPGIVLVVALATALLMGSAAVHKLLAFHAFEVTVGEYRLLTPALVRPVSILVVIVESALTLGLLLPVSRASSAVGASALLSLYALAIGVNLRRGRRDIDCGCTFQQRPIGGWMIARNLALGAFGLLAALPVSNRPLDTPDFVTVVATLLPAALLYIAADLLFGRPQSRQAYPVDAP